MEEIRLGTIGSGAIVHSVLDAVMQTEGIRLEAVYSRTFEKGNALAHRFGAEKVYTDLTVFFADPDVNCIYVASPNSLHYTHVRLALDAHKHVICEKPFVPEVSQARELVALAQERGLMLVDATPTAYIPNLEIVRQHLPRLGKLRMVMTNFSQYSSRYDRLLAGDPANVFTPEFCGGCLMDINYYNLYVNITLFGKPKKAAYYPNCWKNGIDTSGCLVMQYEEFISSNVGAKDTWGTNFLQIEGEGGYIYTKTSNWMEQVHIVTKTSDETFNLQEAPNPYIYEVRSITNLILHQNPSALAQIQNTMLDTIEVLETARKAAGIHFPNDKEAT